MPRVRVPVSPPYFWITPSKSDKYKKNIGFGKAGCFSGFSRFSLFSPKSLRKPYHAPKAVPCRNSFGACLLAASIAVATAQVNVHSYPSHLGKDGSTPQTCLDAGAVLQAEMAKFPHPENWTVYVACDDDAWEKVVERIHPGSTGKFLYGDTDFAHNLTFFRGTTLLGKTRKTTPEHLVAHEPAHIALQSFGEKKVDTQAITWIEQRKLVASK